MDIEAIIAAVKTAFDEDDYALSDFMDSDVRGLDGVLADTKINAEAAMEILESIKDGTEPDRNPRMTISEVANVENEHGISLRHYVEKVGLASWLPPGG